MDNYDYLEAVKSDVRAWLPYYLSDYPRGEDETREEYAARLEEAMFDDDAITGNASGSYTINAAEAKKCVLRGIEQVQEACREFDISLGEKVEAGEWEALDVIARCYYLSQAIAEVVTE